jgi:hypothetical protein
MSTLLRFLRSIATAYDLWQAAQLFSIPSLFSIMTFLAGIMAGGLHWAIFTATGVFAFCMVAVVQGQAAYRSNRIFRTLTLYRGLLSGSTDISDDNTIGITMGIELENRSQKDIYIKVKRITHQIASRVPNEPYKADLSYMLVPGKPFTAFLPTIFGVPVGKQTSGKIDVEIYYGPSPDRLNYLLECEGIPRVYPTIADGKKTISFFCSFDKSTHRRSKYEG